MNTNLNITNLRKHGMALMVGTRTHVFLPPRSANGKTGAVIQHYVLPNNLAAVIAGKREDDAQTFKSTCGHCPLVRKHGKAGCYVLNGFHSRGALKSIATKLANDGYVRITEDDLNKALLAEFFEGEFVRFGAFGEGVDLGETIAKQIMKLCDGHTGYTRKWKMAGYEWAAESFMASVFTPEEAMEAHQRGWSTFQTIRKEDDWGFGILCPASKEAGRTKTCKQCRLCDAKANVHIHAHEPEVVRWAKKSDSSFDENQFEMSKFTDALAEFHAPVIDERKAYVALTNSTGQSRQIPRYAYRLFVDWKSCLAMLLGHARVSEDELRVIKRYYDISGSLEDVTEALAELLLRYVPVSSRQFMQK